MFGLTRGRLAAAGRFLPALLVLAALGCGGSGYRVTGKVTFKGQPVPGGKIYFIPDGTKGNAGPTGYAVIKDGSYDTGAAGGAGVAGGAMVVMIEGLDPSAPPDKADKAGDVSARALFPTYETTADLPKSNTTKDFDVPAEATKGPSKQGGGAGGVIIP
jgi:hypothetical protein